MNCVTHHICDCQRDKMSSLEDRIKQLESVEKLAERYSGVLVAICIASETFGKLHASGLDLEREDHRHIHKVLCDGEVRFNEQIAEVSRV